MSWLGVLGSLQPQGQPAGADHAAGVAAKMGPELRLPREVEAMGDEARAVHEYTEWWCKDGKIG
jgi:hypothetical protein